MKVGLVGWRGMVGSVLLQRMQEENDFAGIEPVFFSTSQAGQPAPMNAGTLKDAADIVELKKLDVILTCQGGDYTKAVHPELRKQGWQGYWIDAASTLRMEDNAVIILDPVNRNVIDKALSAGWPLARVEAVLRAILRAGTFELMYRKDVPARVVITEYVDVTQSFYDEDEPGLVNAVLDNLTREVRAGELEKKAAGQGKR